MTEPASILCVDDEPRVLEGIERTLGEAFNVSVATSGALALEKMRTDGPFAVIVSDMRMPGMDGAAFLEQARNVAPDSVRVLLTGETDLSAAIRAVNAGQIFRFLAKPCPADVLEATVAACAQQHRLVNAERELLEKTVNGVVELLAEVIDLSCPNIRSTRVVARAAMAHLVATEGLVATRWKYDAAIMLATLGYLAVPGDVLDKQAGGLPLLPDEKRMFDAHPEVARQLLKRVPRFEEVAEVVGRQAAPSAGEGGVERGAAMVRVCLAVAERATRGESIVEACKALEPTFRGYERDLLGKLAAMPSVPRAEAGIKRLRLPQLRVGMMVAEPVQAQSGAVLVPAGATLTRPLLERLRTFALGVGVKEPISISV